MLLFSIVTIYEGTYTSMYHSGSAFATFLFIFNLYIGMLLYLNWPIKEKDDAQAPREIQLQEHFSPIDQAEGGEEKQK